jgi:Fe2+ transport system protein FeoA
MMVALDALPVGRRGVVVSLEDEYTCLYLLRFGLTVGAEVELVRAVSGGTMMVFRIDSGELALRREAARGITVRMEPRA